RAAILALAKSGDPAALSALGYVIRTDPDVGLRDLALKAGQQIQKARQKPSPPAPLPHGEGSQGGGSMWPAWALDGRPDGLARRETPSPPAPLPEGEGRKSGAGDIQPLPFQPSWALAADGPAPEPDDEASATAKKALVGPARRKSAQGELRQAFGFATLHSPEEAAAALARAVQLDPGMAGNDSARNLAADLFQMPPKQAMAALLRRIEAGDFEERERKGLRFAQEFGQRAAIIAAELPLLMLTLLYFLYVYSYRVRYSLDAPNPDFILPDVLRLITLDSLGRGLPIALMSLVAVIFFVIVTFFVGAFAGGTGSPMRFISTLLAVQILVFLVIATMMLFVRFAIFVPTGGADEYMVQIHLGWAFIGAAWVLIMEAYAAARAHELDLIKGGVVVVVGFFASAALGGWLGLFRGSMFG
ncbi:MAG: hypothetical protein IT323_09530, partial [Anaerolineae bacterium]|nr:hypothetical protein [Anaerolineae bacterium]